MMKQSLFSYKTLQRIKAQEFELFFRKINRNYYPFLNHLGMKAYLGEGFRSMPLLFMLTLEDITQIGNGAKANKRSLL